MFPVCAIPFHRFRFSWRVAGIALVLCCVFGAGFAPDWRAVAGDAGGTTDVHELPADTTASPGDFYCGPRCVRFLLEWYGLSSPELSEVIREMQPSHVEAGTSLADVGSALQRRGVHTRAIDVPGDSVLAWDSPVVVHLKPEEAGQLGHFAVWLPSSTEQTSDLWVGINGVVSGPTDVLRQSMTDVALLTSPTEIVDDAIATRSATSASSIMIFFADVLFFSILCVVILWILNRWRWPKPRPESKPILNCIRIHAE